MAKTTKTERQLALSMVVRFIAPYRKAVIGALLALIFTAGITLSLGQGIRLLVDQGFVTGSPALLNQSVMLYFVLVAGLAIGTFARFYLVSWLGERVVADIRTQVFDHLITLHPGFFETNRGLEIQSRLTTDTTVLQSVIGSTVSVALRNLVMLVGGIILLFITNPKLTGIVMLAVPLVVAPILIFGRRVRKLSRLSQDRIADVGSYVGEILGQIKTVQAYNHQSEDAARFADVTDRAFSIAKIRVRQRAWMIAIVILLILGAVGAMLWVGGQDVIAGRITGGELAAFVFYALIVGSSAGSLSEVIGELQRAAGAAARIIELLQTESEITPPAQPENMLTLPPTITGKIELEQLRFAYPGRPDVTVIDDISLVIRPGETLALVGPSGAGKSTLFDLLLRFFDPQSGRILLEGLDIRSLDPADLRRCFAFVSQNPALFFGTIADNIRYGRPDAGMDAVKAAARVAYADDFIEAAPQGYDTRLGDAGLGLSGGQKQRIAIARALMTDAPVLLLDEATSALDAESEHLIQQALPKLMAGRTTLVIAHRLATVKHADRIAVVNQGRIQAIGTHQQLIETDPLYARLAALQFQEPEAENKDIPAQ
ncbi:ABC transporter transmembrane domain-containing protein [Marinobacter sp. BGYM27]|uniref:ABC transporter transmembrane domain-containing protein n=1 Tax=Marinobacter sp. BGYM27 TaxID=2975597 RepID=UPI0021A6A8A9|nr:ABC transporter transmembrane domain-containing protein [Marinobacter sp. BGYM27]MDG5501385.1 ABC transporter transmembrane domain-containing protein [Marinobacter sp. BGYM27]